MLLLGVVQAQAAGDEFASSFDLLETQVLTANAASVTFSGLSTFASTHQHLQLRMVARSTVTAFNREGLCFRFNGVSSNSYTEHALTGTGSSVISGAVTNFNRGFMANISTNGDTASVFSPVVVDILDPFASTKNTTTRSFTGRIGSSPVTVTLESGLFINTSAVSSIELFGNDGGSFVTNSRFSLYGIKAD